MAFDEAGRDNQESAGLLIPTRFDHGKARTDIRK